MSNINFKFGRKPQFFKIAKEAFNNDLNVVKTLINEGATKSEGIELAYEMQAGEYTKNFDELNLRRNHEIHKIINKYISDDNINDIAVFGIGEAKNWIGYDLKNINIHGIELSYSRLKYAKKNLDKISQINNFKLIKGDASQKIFNDNSFDITITLHSLEPNGNEQGSKILKNVIDSSNKYILLFEPDFDSAHDEMKKRMTKHDYIRNINSELQSNNQIQIIDKFLLNIKESSNNLTTCWVIKKKSYNSKNKPSFICPFDHDQLVEYDDCFYNKNNGLAFPKVDDFNFINRDDAFFLGLKN
tara:strand:- start:142 stop:1044 length:903 start_codon:yes stop_codon:yes gene_type:complete